MLQPIQFLMKFLLQRNEGCAPKAGQYFSLIGEG
jgi:hypothetical protein